MPNLFSFHEFRMEAIKSYSGDVQSIIRSVARGLRSFKNAQQCIEVFLMASGSFG